MIAEDLRVLHLPPEPASVGRARTWVRRASDGLVGEDAADDAALLTSEIVTNAVLHAGSDITVACESRGDGAVHVRVADLAPGRPVPHRADGEAATGRGLALVEAIATHWGTDAVAGGKVVWFCVGPCRDRHDGSEPAPSTGNVVTFLGLPVALLRATIDYGEAVLRELALESFSASSVDAGLFRAPSLDLQGVYAVLADAEARGDVTVDATVDFPEGSAAHALNRAALVEEGDRGAGRLLVIEPIPEIAHCRRWFYRQIALQPEGLVPERWVMPPAADREDPGTITDAAVAGFRDLDTAVVVASSANRIVFANDRAATLLGWDPEALVGRRLVAIIPERHRAAHLGGFARHQLTGEERVLGRELAVPVLHCDGHEVPVRMRITKEHDPEAGDVFVARFDEADRSA